MSDEILNGSDLHDDDIGNADNDAIVAESGDASDVTATEVESYGVVTDSTMTDELNNRAYEETNPTDEEEKGKDYIHIGCAEIDEPLVELIKKYGFECRVCGAESDITSLYESIHGADAVIVIESNDLDYDARNMAYQIREAIACGLEPIVVCRRDGSELAKKFEGEDNVYIIKCGSQTEILHLLFVERLCKLTSVFHLENCERDETGNIIIQAVDAWLEIAASERHVAEKYDSGVILPKIGKQAVFWYTRAVEHGSIKSLVALGNCYFDGNGCPENKKKAYEKYCEAVEKGSAEGYLKKGICLLNSQGCEADSAEAYECLRSAIKIKKNYPEAEYYVGLCLAEGRGTEASSAEAKSYFLKSAKGDFVPALLALGNIFTSVGDDYNPEIAYEYYSRAAAQGSVEGLYKQGLALSSGDGCEKDEKIAYEKFSEGAVTKDVACLSALGMCYEFGIGTEIDYEKAVEYYSLATDKGYPPAVNNLGGCYYYGHGVARDRKKAIELFESASLMGDVNATARLGLCYESGEDCDRDFRRAFGYFLSAANAGSAVASFKVAQCYESGRGTEKNFKQAFHYYEYAASLGHAESAWHTANCLSDGVGTEQDYWLAFKWYSKGAEAGHADCYLQMAHFCFKGIGTAKNYAKAYYCYNKAFELGADCADTALRIGICNLRGLGTEEDRLQALRWFKKSAALGSANAIYLCGECYYYGSGCERDYKRAIKYYATAVNLGHTRATVALADCYEQGLGISQNTSKALSLYKRASAHDNSQANYKMAKLVCDEDMDITTLALPRLFRASNHGYAPATLLLGRLYDEGRGIPENTAKASEKYLKAIRLGTERQKILLFSLPERDKENSEFEHSASVEATYRLGMLKGRLAKVVDDYTQAFEYIAGAAATGSAEAQSEIAKIYASGGDLHDYFQSGVHSDEPDGVEIANAMNKLGDAWYDGKPILSKNDRVALKCYRIAAKMGQNDAAYNLGWCLRHGVGGKVDDVEASKWLKKSADNGNAHAAYSYGLCCEEGSGMDHPNIRDAATYYRKAAALGHIEAKKRYAKMSEK